MKSKKVDKCSYCGEPLWFPVYDELSDKWFCHTPHYDSGPGGDCLEKYFLENHLPEFLDLMDIGFDEEDLDPDNDYNPYNRKVIEDVDQPY